MRSLESARDVWTEFKRYQMLQELKVAVRLDGSSSLATIGGRSACWKVFLLFEDLDTSSWIRTLNSARSAYNSLRSHFLQSVEDAGDSGAPYDPLSEKTDVSYSVLHYCSNI